MDSVQDNGRWEGPARSGGQRAGCKEAGAGRVGSQGRGWEGALIGRRGWLDFGGLGWLSLGLGGGLRTGGEGRPLGSRFEGVDYWEVVESSSCLRMGLSNYYRLVAGY